MADLFRNLLSLVVFILVAYVLVLIGLALIPVVLTIFCIAFVWYFFKLYKIRKAMEQTIREHGDTSFHSAMRQNRDATSDIIEVEYEEVIVEKDKKD